MNTINWIELSIGGLIGFLTSLMTASIFEWIRKPNLIIKIDQNPNLGSRRIKKTIYEWKFLNVIIENQERPWWKSWLKGNVPAENARAWVSFRYFDSDIEFLQIGARWATTKEPLNEFGKPEWSSLLVTSRESIPVREKASLAIAVKTNQSDNLFAFNNESYLFYPEYPPPFNTLWSKQEYEIGNERKYKVCVRILTQGKEYTEKFILLNPRRSYSSVLLIVDKIPDCD